MCRGFFIDTFTSSGVVEFLSLVGAILTPIVGLLLANVVVLFVYVIFKSFAGVIRFDDLGDKESFLAELEVQYQLEALDKMIITMEAKE